MHVMRMVRPAAAIPALLAVTALLAWALPASSAESDLVQNGAFNTGVSDWAETYAGSVTWSPEDAGNNASSGSLKVTNSGTDPENMLAIQCRPLPPAATMLSFKGSVKNASPGDQSIAFLGAAFMTGPNCGGDFISSLGFNDTDGPDWSTGTASGPIPANAVSIEVRLGLNRFGTDPVVVAVFDNIFVTVDVDAPAADLRLVLPLMARD